MALRKIRDREVQSNRCTHSTRYTAWDSCLGLVCSEEVAGDDELSGFPQSSEVLELEFDDLAVLFLRIAGQILLGTLGG
jgi:hypothetical protein